MIGDDDSMGGGEISLSLLLGLSLSLVFGRFLIPRLEELNVGQQIRPEGPESHKKKSGTPTMGGIIFISAIIISRIIVYLYKKTIPSKEELLVLGLMVSYGLIGFVDDYRKVKLGRSLGLRAREKFALQVLFAVLFLWGVPEMNTEATLPFIGSTWEMGWLYPLFALVLILGTANGMNFTDGLDGLAAGVASIGLLAYFVIITFIISPAYGKAIGDLSSLALCSVGALLGFLYYNHHPARVFMGDLGSLALGGLLAGFAICTRTEMAFPFIVAVQFVEVVSVILQVASFQLFGKRIFKMTPIHHHFELLGWSERKVVLLFWCFSFVMAIIGVASLLRM